MPSLKESKTAVSQIDTGDNVRMLGAINLSGSVLICPAVRSIVSYSKHGQRASQRQNYADSGHNSPNMNSNNKTNVQSGVLQICELNKGKLSSIVCHKRELVYMELDHAGQKCATAGLLGTIIRIWGLKDQNLLYELRRGADPAVIYSFSFASLGLLNSGKLLICSSNKGTVHIWKTFGDANVSTSSKKIQSARGESDSLYTDIANFVRHGSQTERRSICSFSIDPDDACYVKLLNNKNSEDASTLPSSGKTSSNLCAIVVTKSGHYYKYHVDINRQLTSKLVKENLIEDGFNTSFS